MTSRKAEHHEHHEHTSTNMSALPDERHDRSSNTWQQSHVQQVRPSDPTADAGASWDLVLQLTQEAWAAKDHLAAYEQSTNAAFEKLANVAIEQAHQLFAAQVLVTRYIRDMKRVREENDRLRAELSEARLGIRVQPEPDEDELVTLPCGCAVLKGWRCPVHGAP